MTASGEVQWSEGHAAAAAGNGAGHGAEGQSQPSAAAKPHEKPKLQVCLALRTATAAAAAGCCRRCMQTFTPALAECPSPDPCVLFLSTPFLPLLPKPLSWSFHKTNGAKVKIPRWPDRFAIPISDYEAFDGSIGAKSRNCGLLRSKIPTWVKVPASVTLPLGTFEKARETAPLPCLVLGPSASPPTCPSWCTSECILLRCRCSRTPPTVRWP